MFYSFKIDWEEEEKQGRKHKGRGGGDRQYSRQCGLLPSFI